MKQYLHIPKFIEYKPVNLFISDKSQHDQGALLAHIYNRTRHKTYTKVDFTGTGWSKAKELIKHKYISKHIDESGISYKLLPKSYELLNNYYKEKPQK